MKQVGGATVEPAIVTDIVWDSLKQRAKMHMNRENIFNLKCITKGNIVPHHSLMNSAIFDH